MRDHATYLKSSILLNAKTSIMFLIYTSRQNEMYSRFCKLFFLRSPILPWEHGTTQQGWYVGGTLEKQSPNLTAQFILSPGI